MRNMLAMMVQPPGQQLVPINMLAQQVASAEEGFDPNGPIAQMLRAQRAAAAAQAARQMQQSPPATGKQPPPLSETATEVLRRRMREQGLE